MDSSLAFELASLDAIGRAELVAAGEVAAALDTAGGLCTGEAGPLAGVPFLLKDLGASLAGTREAMGSRALRKHVATESAWIVERYLEAGLVIFGKTNTPEWGNHCTTEPSLFGPTVNPWSSSIAGWTSLANVTGWAAISLPLGVTSQGLPIGVRLIPDEAVLLQLAAQLEVAAPWLHRWPSM